MFDNVRVPQENLLGKRGDGFKMAMKGLDGGRINIGSCSLGGAQHAFDRTKQYMTERKQFGKLLKEQQYLQFKLADMATSLTSSRLMLRNAARMLDIDHPVMRHI
jgi:alkylation response protein AidB-like acyl-CoA dehydrogenase